jgi:hypothetical protein
LNCSTWPCFIGKRVAVMLFWYLWQDGILSDADYPEKWQTLKRAWEASKGSAGTA